MATIFEAMTTVKGFLSKLLNVGVNEIEITKVVKINDGWEVEAFNEESIGKKRSYSIFVDDSREVKSYEKKGLRDSI